MFICIIIHIFNDAHAEQWMIELSTNSGLIMQMGVFVAVMQVVFSSVHHAWLFLFNYAGDTFFYSYVGDSFK